MNKISSKAATQLYEIILLLPSEYKSKIPMTIMSLLQNRKIAIEEINIKSAEHINDTELLDETKKYLSYIFLNYLADEDEKKEFNHILDENEARHQALLKNKYDTTNMFRVEEKKESNLEVEDIRIDEEELNEKDNENNQLIEIKGNNWFSKILEKIKKLIWNLGTLEKFHYKKTKKKSETFGASLNFKKEVYNN